jgi:hypothetical protein
VVGRTLAIAMLSVPAIATAGPWKSQFEIGGEVDTNVQRVETGSELETDPRTAPLLRAGFTVERSRPPGHGTGWGALLVTGLRSSLDTSITSENAITLGADVHVTRSTRGKPLAIGGRASYLDVVPVGTVEGTRTYRTATLEGTLAVRRDDGDTVTLSAGIRDLVYKQDDDFDFFGPGAGIRIDHTLWHDADDTRTLELSTSYRIERRAYAGLAYRCVPDPMSANCSAPTELPRVDTSHAASIDATYTGERVISGGYQLIAIDSNSFGYSIVRHRLSASATTELFGSIYVTATVTGQLDQYLDSLILSREVASQTFTRLDDDNRSSVQLRFARALDPKWSLEARVAAWTNALGANDVDYRRFLVYSGLIRATAPD